MKSIQIELPDKLAEALDTMVQQGWFRSEEEVLRFALLEFLRRHRLELHEQLQRDEICVGTPPKGCCGVRRLVSDTGPLLHLYKAACLDVVVPCLLTACPPCYLLALTPAAASP